MHINFIRKGLFILGYSIIVISGGLCVAFLSACNLYRNNVNTSNAVTNSIPTGVKNDDRQVKQDDTTKAINLYQKFLEGKINAISDDGDVTLDDIFRFDDQSLLKYNKYVFYDINGDKIPELLTSQISDCIFIFTVEKGKLFVWHDMISYCKILNNGDALTTVLSDGPPHISYAYNIFDYNGNDKFNIEFEKYDSNEDGKYDKKDQYYFDEIRVSKQEWDSLTKRYLNIGTDKIQWKFYTENIGVQ